MSATPSSPYKGLNAFEDTALDALLFFGRERETEIVVANLIASRLTVLYGPSGVGKSSLLRAAVARSLRKLPEEPLVIVFSSWSDDPNTALSEAVAEAAGRSPNGSAVSALELAQSDRDVYLVLDQAEEYFLYHADDAGPGTFAEALPSVIGAPLRVNVLISLREDSLAKLDRFRGEFQASSPIRSGWIVSTARLREPRSSARAKRYSEIQATPSTSGTDLAELVLDEVGAGQIELAVRRTRCGREGHRRSPDRGALPSARDAAHLGRGGGRRVADPSRRDARETRRVPAHHRGTSRPGDGRAFGRAEGHRREALQPSRDAFWDEVRPRGLDLAEYGRVPMDQLRPVLAMLSERRILRAFEEGAGVRYEIFHDVLGRPILAWRARHRTQREIERQLADAHGRRSRLQRLLLLSSLCCAHGCAGRVRADSRGTTRAPSPIARRGGNSPQVRSPS